MANKVLDSVGLTYFWGKIKAAFASKVSSATSGNFAGLDSNGNLTDSGHSNSDFVHKTGNETISGRKTFDEGISIDNGHNLTFKSLVNGNDYGPYMQGEYDTTNQEPTLSFYGSYGDEAVRLINIENPRNNTDAANKSYVDTAINNAGYLAPSDVVTIYSGSTAPSNSFGSNGDIYIQTA